MPPGSRSGTRRRRKFTYPVSEDLGAGDNVRAAASPEAAPSAIAIDARGPAEDGGSEGSEEGGRGEGVDGWRGELHIRWPVEGVGEGRFGWCRMI